MSLRAGCPFGSIKTNGDVIMVQRIFFNNYLLMLPVVSWLSAQTAKTLLDFIINRKINIERLVGSGGMPSAHSAAVCSLMVGSAKDQGMSSPIFAISFVFALVVIYDAMNVRLETGKQSKLLNLIMEVMRDEWQELSNEKKLKELVGHTPLQILIGALLGVFIAVLIPVF